MGEFTDLICTLAGYFARWLNIKKIRLCFLVWFFCVVYWLVRNIGLDLRVQAAGCFVSMLIHLYGFRRWKDEP